MRTLIFITVLAGLAPSAFAATHYVEIWNPPEARPAPVQPSAQKRESRKLLARKVPRTVARKVTDAAGVGAAAAPSTPPALRRPVKPSLPSKDIPRKIGPDGNVFRVSYPPGRCRPFNGAQVV